MIALFLQQILSVHMTECPGVSAQMKGNGVQRDISFISILHIAIRALCPSGSLWPGARSSIQVGWRRERTLVHRERKPHHLQVELGPETGPTTTICDLFLCVSPLFHLRCLSSPCIRKMPLGSKPPVLLAKDLEETHSSYVVLPNNPEVHSDWSSKITCLQLNQVTAARNLPRCGSPSSLS